MPTSDEVRAAERAALKGRLALSIQQPYGWAILHAGKRIENRRWNWPGKLPCRIVIHVGQREYAGGRMHLACLGIYPPADLPKGCVVGEATVVAQLDPAEIGGAQELWAEGPVCLVLEDVVAYKHPIPWAGRLGLFDL